MLSTLAITLQPLQDLITVFTKGQCPGFAALAYFSLSSPPGGMQTTPRKPVVAAKRARAANGCMQELVTVKQQLALLCLAVGVEPHWQPAQS